MQEEVALHQARRIVREPAMRSLGLLIRTWTRYSEPGQPRPRAGQVVRVRDAREPESLSHAANP